MLDSDEVFVSTSPVPRIWPVSNSQRLVLTLPRAGPLKLSAQTSFHGGGSPTALDAAEQPLLARAVRMLSLTASRSSRREAPVRSAAPSAYRPSWCRFNDISGKS